MTTDFIAADPAGEDWIFRVITDRDNGWSELYWRYLVAMDVRLAALALNANPAFRESYWPHLQRGAKQGAAECLPIMFWATVLDDDPVTVKLVVHEVVTSIEDEEEEP